MNYPCDIYAGSALNPVISVCQVRTGEAAGVPDDWFEKSAPLGAFKACPLLDLMKDGKLYATDFRVWASVPSAYLKPEGRIASLTEFGVCYLRQRLIASFARGSVSIEKLRDAHRATWDEMELWEYWNGNGLGVSDYQSWLDEMDTSLGMSPRRALDRDDAESVRRAIDASVQKARETAKQPESASKTPD
jgi:hypothetical protein